MLSFVLCTSHNYYACIKINMAVQRGNAASVLGTMKMGSQEEEFLYKYVYCVSE